MAAVALGSGPGGAGPPDVGAQGSDEFVRAPLLAGTGGGGDDVLVYGTAST